jgi:carbon storage regulator
MLVLTRLICDEIVIDGYIRLKVTAVKGDRVRLGISAPPQVRVDRAEVCRHRVEAEPADPAS